MHGRLTIPSYQAMCPYQNTKILKLDMQDANYYPK